MLRDSEGHTVARKDSGSHGHQTRGGGRGEQDPPTASVKGWARGPPPPAPIRAAVKTLAQNELLPTRTKFNLVT